MKPVIEQLSALLDAGFILVQLLFSDSFEVTPLPRGSPTNKNIPPFAPEYTFKIGI